MYACHAVFGEDRRGFEEGRFWFQDGLHAAEPLYPFDSIAFEYAMVAFNQASSRLFVVAPSLGSECRLLNGYVYLSANLVTDEPTLARRAELYAGRGGYYFEHWNGLYQRWLERVETATSDLVELEVPEMPELEDESIVTEGRGLGSSYALLQAYDRLLEGVDRIFQYHFEFLNLGYAAYLVFYERCRQAFPGHLGPRPSQRWCRRSTSSSYAPTTSSGGWRAARSSWACQSRWQAPRTRKSSPQPSSAAIPAHGGSPTSSRTKDPWFYFSCGTGVFHHHHRSWIDDTRFPIRMIGSDIARLGAGEDIARPAEAMLAERERVTEEHRALVPPELCHAFDESLELAERSSRTSRTTTSTSTTATSRSSGTRCASSGGPCAPRVPGGRRGRLPPPPRRGAVGSGGAACATGARGAQGWRAVPVCGRRAWSGEGRSTTQCACGLHLPPSAIRPRR